MKTRDDMVARSAGTRLVYGCLVLVLGCQSPPPSPTKGCEKDVDCPDDGIFCNGVDLCREGVCVSSGPMCDEVDGLCGPACDEEANACYAFCRSDAECDDGSFCDGVETCDGCLCHPGVPPCSGCSEETGCR